MMEKILYYAVIVFIIVMFVSFVCYVIEAIAREIYSNERGSPRSNAEGVTVDILNKWEFEVSAKEEEDRIKKAAEADLIGWMMNEVQRVNSELTQEEAFDIAYNVWKHSKMENFDPLLVLSVLMQESDAVPDAVGEDGEVGLMQVKPDTFEFLGFDIERDEMFDIETNILAGISYLKHCKLLTKPYTDSNWHNARYMIYGFNRGHNAVIRVFERGSFEENDYTREVLDRYTSYGERRRS